MSEQRYIYSESMGREVTLIDEVINWRKGVVSIYKDKRGHVIIRGRDFMTPGFDEVIRFNDLFLDDPGFSVDEVGNEDAPYGERPPAEEDE